MISWLKNRGFLAEQSPGFFGRPHISKPNLEYDRIHRAGSWIKEAGIPPKIKQYLMGHASLDMTQRVYTDTQAHYIEAFADRVRDTFDT